MTDREVVEREVIHTPPGGGGTGVGVVVGILVAAAIAVVIGLFVFGGDDGDVDDDGIIPEQVDVNVDVDEPAND